MALRPRSIVTSRCNRTGSISPVSVEAGLFHSTGFPPAIVNCEQYPSDAAPDPGKISVRLPSRRFDLCKCELQRLDVVIEPTDAIERIFHPAEDSTESEEARQQRGTNRPARDRTSPEPNAPLEAKRIAPDSGRR